MSDSINTMEYLKQLEQENTTLTAQLQQAEAQVAELQGDLNMARQGLLARDEQLAQAKRHADTLDAAVRVFLDKMYQHPRTTCEHFLSRHQAEEHAISPTRGDE